MPTIEELTVVAMLEDLPEQNLQRGQVGTVVDVWEPGVYEIEFVDTDGATYAVAALKGSQLMPLYFSPVSRAA
jgi:hypothetical protein